MMRTTLLVLCVLALTGCTARPAPDVTPVSVAASPGAALTGKSFEAVEVTENGARRALVPGTTIEVRFEADHTVVAEAGCNRLTAPVAIGRARLDVGRIRTTDKDCRDALLAQDHWLAVFLRANPSWRQEASGVVLESGPTTIRLAPPAPARPEAIVGIEWVVYGLTDAMSETGTPPGLEPHLTFDGTQVVGDTTCAQLRAPAVVGPGTIDLGPVVLTSVRPCPSAASTLHRAVTDVLRANTRLTYTLDGARTLRLRSGDPGLLLRPR
ncbi:META domain-containing protein [Cryptosporangium sp. NPDC051539]|uniref:META domain-containing protein n=1 Tax=Cryptosporangium sp. NPDC051539 TaxID=3363962 RepID=UPI00379FDD37